MRDPNVDSIEQVRFMDRAIKRKWNRAIRNGVVLTVGGAVVIVIGMLLGALLNKGPYSRASLIVGAGILFIVVGVMSLLFGLINPLAPGDLRPSREEMFEVVQEEEVQRDYDHTWE